MPVNFGENDLLGSLGKDAHAVCEDITSIFLSCTTNCKQLQQHLPQGFELSEPLSRFSRQRIAVAVG